MDEEKRDQQEEEEEVDKLREGRKKVPGRSANE